MCIHDFQGLGQRKFVSWHSGSYNLLAGKKDEKIHVFEVLIFLETYCYYHYQEILFKDNL